MEARFKSLASGVSTPCFAWLRYYSFIKQGSDELELVRQGVAHGTEDEQKERVWQLLATTVLKHDITKRRSKNESALRTFKHRLLPIMYEYAMATVGPDLPYSVWYSDGKKLGVSVKGDTSVSSQLLEESGLKGWVEPLSPPFNSEIATDMGYPSCIKSQGWDGLLYGPMSLLNEADKPTKSLFEFKPLPGQDLRVDNSGISSQRACQPVHMKRKVSGGTENTRVRVCDGDELTVWYGGDVHRAWLPNCHCTACVDKERNSKKARMTR